ncbi:unnamed protein product [Diatraea saccharalis]|uniref:Uncharacterized protein n=1 Tax=Diatraea saccharalis TaxID=40085 RepID=A0A9N9WDJ5_9NEOP|nr:unnamed protein product [Diatraea saccharalis]
MSSGGISSYRGCRRTIEDRRFLYCGGCKQIYDLECADVSEQRFYNTLTKEYREAWRWVLCKSLHPKADNSNTPVRGGADGIIIHRGAAVRSPTELNKSIVEQPSSPNDTAHNMTIEVSDFRLL